MPVEIDKSEAGEQKREERRERFSKILRERGIKRHGAQTLIAEQIGVSDATVAAWMRGSMPRDPEVFFKFCDNYDVDPYWWTSGKYRPRHEIDVDLIVESVEYVTQREQARGSKLTSKQRTKIAARAYKDWSNRESIVDDSLDLF